jgi:membrane fusion protein (multidrug efflux system)
MKNQFLWVLLGSSTLLAGCASDQQKKKADDEKTFPVVKLALQPATVQREYVGNLEAIRNVEIRARVPGFLDKIFVDEGQQVRKGQLLFQINEKHFEADLAKAAAQLKSKLAEAKAAELELGRVKLLVEKKIISPSEQELVKARLDAAQAGIDEARAVQTNAALHLSHARIRAPFDGVINRLPFKLGSLIDEGALLTTVSDIREVYAYFHVSEKEYLEYIKKRQKGIKTNDEAIQLFLADGTPYTQEGKIETMESIFGDNSGTIAFRARFPNPQGLLKHGATGKIRLSNQVTNAILVPQKAVFEIQDRNYVYVVDADNKVKMRSFVPRRRLDKFYIVESGLKPGERVVYEGIQNIEEGMSIVPEPLSVKTREPLSASVD